ncbi:MAG: AAA family ATPase [Pseudomonadota bacterium]|nr:AAA family ATPase [Pseudomonadota bacterium]
MQRAVLNQKGGVGKSSIAIDLAAPSAKAGLKTFLGGLDVQGNGTHYIMGKPSEPPSGVEDFFKTNYRCIQENRSSL